MCTKDGIIDEGCKQCSNMDVVKAATEQVKAMDIKPTYAKTAENIFCSDEVPTVVIQCKDLPQRWNKKLPKLQTK